MKTNTQQKHIPSSKELEEALKHLNDLHKSKQPILGATADAVAEYGLNRAIPAQEDYLRMQAKNDAIISQDQKNVDYYHTQLMHAEESGSQAQIDSAQARYDAAQEKLAHDSAANANQENLVEHKTPYIGPTNKSDIIFIPHNEVERYIVDEINYLNKEYITTLKTCEYAMSAEYFVGEIANFVGIAQAAKVFADNRRYVRDIQISIREEVNGINQEHFMTFLQKNKKYKQLSAELIAGTTVNIDKLQIAIKDFCKQKAVSDIGWSTFLGGFAGTSSGAGAIYIAGGLIPGAKIITLPMAAIAAIVGLSGTAVGVVVSRYQLSKKIATVFDSSDQNIQVSLSKAATKIIEKSKNNSYSMNGKLIEKTTQGIEHSTIAYRFLRLERFSAAFTTLPQMIGNSIATFGSIATSLSGILDIKKGLERRKADMENPLAFFVRANRAYVICPKYILFGKSKFDEYLIKSCPELNHQSTANQISEFKAKLSTEDYTKFFYEAEAERYKAEYNKFMNSKTGKALVGTTNDLPGEFIKYSIAKEFSRQTFYSDLFAGLKISGAIAMTGAINYAFHPLLVCAEIFAAASIVVAVGHSSLNKRYATKLVQEQVLDNPKANLQLEYIKQRIQSPKAPIIKPKHLSMAKHPSFWQERVKKLTSSRQSKNYSDSH